MRLAPSCQRILAECPNPVSDVAFWPAWAHRTALETTLQSRRGRENWVPGNSRL